MSGECETYGSARDVIAAKLPCAENIRKQWADEIISALTAAGYRIVGPGELDALTLEKAAKVAAHHRGVNFIGDKGRNSWRLPTKHDIATAIRALGRKA